MKAQNKIKAIVRKMRRSVKGSIASKVAREVEERGYCDIQEAATCLRDDDEFIADMADEISAALKDPKTVYRVLADFHNSNYSVFPRDKMTERLCHAFHDQFVKA